MLELKSDGRELWLVSWQAEEGGGERGEPIDRFNDFDHAKRELAKRGLDADKLPLRLCLSSRRI